MTHDLLAINGGEPVRTAQWHTYEDGTKISSDEVKSLVNQVIDSGRLFRYDTRAFSETMTGKFENALAKYFGSRHTLAVTSGTTALALALMALDLPKGFEVACPTFGFPATASSVLLAGGVPKLFASDEHLYYNMQDVKSRWRDEIKVIIVVHMRGYAQPIDKIMAFAKEKGIYVIEDAVPSLGVCADGKFLGTYGDVGCFSMQSDKTIVTGEGGFLVTDNKEYFEKAVLFSGAYESRVKRHEIETHEDWEMITPLFSFRLDEVRAAIALPQLGNVQDKVAKLQSNFRYIADALSSVDGLRLRKPTYEDGYLGDSLIFFVEKCNANWVSDAITAEGVKARCFGRNDNVRSFEQWKFLDELHSREFHSIEAIANTKKYLGSAVDIPLSVHLSKNDLDDAVNSVLKVMKHV